MHIIKKKIMKSAAFFLLPVLMLTACTGKNDIVFDTQEQEKMQGAEYTANMGNTADAENADTGENEPAQETEPGLIYVHICGAVVSPGVYELKAGSRVFEGIEAAGGFSTEACKDYVNQAKILQDGQRLVIPTMEEAEAAKENGSDKEPWMTDDTEAESEVSSGGSAEGLVNINTADESELSSIAGIGEGKAAAIVRYRQEHGNFQSIEDIMKVSGIKEGTYEKIKEKITVK